VIPDREISRAALAMVKRYAADAMLEAAARADQLLEDGDWQAGRDPAPHPGRDRAATVEGAGVGRGGALEDYVRNETIPSRSRTLILISPAWGRAFALPHRYRIVPGRWRSSSVADGGTVANGPRLRAS
jgi:hypothetical protein